MKDEVQEDEKISFEDFFRSIFRFSVFMVIFLPLTFALDVGEKAMIGIPLRFLIPFCLAQGANIFYGLLEEIRSELKKK